MQLTVAQVIADALGSVAVIIGGRLITLYDWVLIDPIVTILIVVYFLWRRWAEIGGMIRVLMLGSPSTIETKAACEALNSVDGTEDVYNFHLWMMEEKVAAFQAHVTIQKGLRGEADAIKASAPRIRRGTCHP